MAFAKRGTSKLAQSIDFKSRKIIKGLKRQSVSIIVVNYKTLDLLRSCLDSIQSQIEKKDEIIVVDNASKDSTVQIVKEKYPWVKCVANHENAGYARANNQALSIAKGDIFWFLNPDTRLYNGALEAALDYMDSNAKVGLAGTALKNTDGSPQHSMEKKYPSQRYVNNLLDKLPGDIAWVMGSSMVARRTAVEQAGRFDERHFLYGEDLDICLSIRKVGWEIGFIEDCQVLHIGGQSERDTPPASLIRKKMMAELRFFEKHYPPQAIRQIKRNNRIQALWRLATLSPYLLFRPNDEKAATKYLKYSLAWQIYR